MSRFRNQTKETQELRERALVTEKDLEAANLQADHERTRRADLEERLQATEAALHDERMWGGVERDRADQAAERARHAEIEAAELRAEAKVRAERRWWRRSVKRV